VQEGWIEMSGYKHATVTISQDEYRRLQEADIKKRFKEFSRISAQDAGQNEVVLNLIKEMEVRELQLQNALNSMEQSTQPYDNEILQNILNQNSRYYDNLAGILRETNTDLENTISSLTEEFSQAMQQEREQVFQNLQSLFYEQMLYQGREFEKEDAAQQWLARCLGYAEFIQNQYDHRRFTPGCMERIMRNLGNAEANLANGFTEISIQTSQQSFLELSDLNFELEQLILQWQSAYELTMAEVNDFIMQMDANALVHGLDLQGMELPELVNLDYWTQGRYQQLLIHCKQLANYLVEDRSILSLDDIDRIYNQVLPAIRESFESIVFDSRLGALNSQLRMNIAEKALQALEQHGFVLDKAGYSDNDMRAQFNARLECMDGSQVTIQVLPTEKSSQELSNDLVVITTHPYLKTDHETMLQWEEMSQTLRQYQLKVSRPEVLTIEEATSTEQYRRSKLLEQSQSHLEG
jgi:hypothetical protein